jgi:hypothetical protein
MNLFVELPTWAIIHKIGLLNIQRAEVNISEVFNLAIFCHDCRFSVPAECVIPVVHDGLEVVRHIPTVDSNFVVFFKSKSII